MNILIVAATAAELEPFKVPGISPEVLITGVGTVAAAYHLTRQLRLKEYRMVIQAGLAGSFDPGASLGEVVSVRSDRFSDRFIREKGVVKPIHETDLVNGDVFPFWQGRLVNPNPEISSFPFRQVTAVTADSISDDSDVIGETRRQYAADIETMEGAAFHYVCLMEDVPFLQLRAISNYVGERDKSKWELKMAVRNLNEGLERILKGWS